MNGGFAVTKNWTAKMVVLAMMTVTMAMVSSTFHDDFASMCQAAWCHNEPSLLCYGTALHTIYALERGSYAATFHEIFLELWRWSAPLFTKSSEECGYSFCSCCSKHMQHLHDGKKGNRATTNHQYNHFIQLSVIDSVQ